MVVDNNWGDAACAAELIDQRASRGSAVQGHELGDSCLSQAFQASRVRPESLSVSVRDSDCRVLSAGKRQSQRLDQDCLGSRAVDVVVAQNPYPAALPGRDQLFGSILNAVGSSDSLGAAIGLGGSLRWIRRVHGTREPLRQEGALPMPLLCRHSCRSGPAPLWATPKRNWSRSPLAGSAWKRRDCRPAGTDPPRALPPAGHLDAFCQVLSGTLSNGASPAAARRRLAMPISPSGRSSGNRITSRIVGEFVSSITNRSIPMPSPAVGGRP